MLNNEPFSLIKYIFLVGEMHGTGRDSNGISELPLIQLNLPYSLEIPLLSLSAGPAHRAVKTR